MVGWWLVRHLVELVFPISMGARTELMQYSHVYLAVLFVDTGILRGGWSKLCGFREKLVYISALRGGYIREGF